MLNEEETLDAVDWKTMYRILLKGAIEAMDKMILQPECMEGVRVLNQAVCCTQIYYTKICNETEDGG